MAYTRTNLAASTAAVTNRLVTSTNMKVGAYTVVNSGLAAHGAGFTVTATITPVTGNDTVGTLVVVGKNLAGQTVTETITLTAGTGGSGTQIFKSVTSITGAGWVINVGNDTIVVGTAAGAYVLDGAGVLYAVVVNATTATSIVVADAAGTIASLKASITENTYYYECAVAGYIKLTHAGTSDYTVIHSDSVPTYATT